MLRALCTRLRVRLRTSDAMLPSDAETPDECELVREPRDRDDTVLRRVRSGVSPGESSCTSSVSASG